MTARFTILIKQQNYGWSCSRSAGVDRVFALKEQAIQFAQQQCAFSQAEIRIRERDGAEQCLVIGPRLRQVALRNPVAAGRDIIPFAAQQ